MRKAWEYLHEAVKNVNLSHVVLLLVGRVNEKYGEKFYFVVVAARTNSRLRIGHRFQSSIKLHKKV